MLFPRIAQRVFFKNVFSVEQRRMPPYSRLSLRESSAEYQHDAPASESSITSPEDIHSLARLAGISRACINLQALRESRVSSTKYG